MDQSTVFVLMLYTSQHCLFWCSMYQSTVFVLMQYVPVNSVCFDAVCTSQHCLFWCSMYQSTVFVLMQYVPVNIVCFDVYVLVNIVCFDALCISQHCLFWCFMYQSLLYNYWLMRHWIWCDIDQRIPILTEANPRSTFVFSSRYHIISNASLVNNCFII